MEHYKYYKSEHKCEVQSFLAIVFEFKKQISNSSGEKMRKIENLLIISRETKWSIWREIITNSEH